ncbi:MAG: hypothetical protein HC830_13705 [Bacteroidetes bacterium]|nr:hypothetical protein [Bacteroidota bacterium]
MTKGWKKKANHDLWEQLDKTINGRSVAFEWVKELKERKINPNPIITELDPNEPQNSIVPTPQQQEGLDKMSVWLALPRDSVSNNLFR